MAAPATFEEMEAKRQMMITSFVQIANSMRQCIACIEEYTRHDPGSVNNATTGHALAQLQAAYPQGNVVDPALGASAPAAKPLKGKAAKAAAAAAAAPPAANAEAVAATPLVKAKKEKKEKPVRDPDAPKRPASAYILFQNAFRPTLVQPGGEQLSYKEQMRQTAEVWKNMTAEQKKPYEDKYQKDVGVFKVALQTYEDGKGAETTAAPGTIDPAALGSQARHPAAPASESDDTSSDSSDDAPPPTINKAKPNKAAAPPTPATLAAMASTPAANGTPKEKKRKHKDAAPAAPVTPATGEKKKKSKKNKE